jgi:glucose dehydrogenase
MSNKALPVVIGIVAVAALLWVIQLGEEPVEESTGDAARIQDITEIGDAEIADESSTEDWLAYGRTHSEQRFSPLTDVNRDTVSRLGVAWYMDLPNDVGLVSTPLVVDGILYFTGTMNVIRAVEATTGDLVWEYDPDVAGNIGQDRQVGWVHNRGISFYKGKIFAATWDGRLSPVRPRLSRTRC